MNKFVLRYKSLKAWQWILLFIGLYYIILNIFVFANKLLNLGIGLILVQIIFLYIFSMLFMKIQLHRVEYGFEDDHLIVKEYLSNKERFVQIIPIKQVLSIGDQMEHDFKYYHKRKKLIKKYKKLPVFFIEYDDFMDVSLLQVQCDPAFINLIRKHM